VPRSARTGPPRRPRSAAITTRQLLRADVDAVDTAFWPALAARALAWLRDHGLAVADAVVLLPFAELLPLARAGFAAWGGWPPRVETVATLAGSLGPPPLREPGAPTGDRLADRLSASALLRGQSWGAAWARRDVRGFEHAAAALVDAAHALGRAAAARPVAERAAWWVRGRDVLGPVAGPGQTERALARIALEWAALDDRADTDRLFALRPSAWIVVHAGGVDPCVRSLVDQTPVPVLEVVADPPSPGLFDAALGLPPPRRVVCEGLEDEAQAAAAEVLRAVAEQRAPVALVALDRALVRRVHALLERTPGLRVHDETGWRLSTTRAAARVMAALRAAVPQATRDAWLDWLKADAALPPPALLQLEAAWREGRAAPPDVDAAWQAQRERLVPLAAGGRRSLAHWLQALAGVLGPAGDDAAAQQVAAALRLDGATGGGAWQRAAGEARLDLAGCTRWVDDVLDAGVYRPPAPAAPHVVITPLARALLRPFGAVVCPGADDRRLGSWPAADPLLGDAVAQALGLPTPAELRAREALAFAQLLRLAPTVLLRRGRDGGEPLGASPLVERAVRARERLGAACLPEETWQPTLEDVERAPRHRPAPVVVDALPARLSASAVQALRDCPYRFFARALLRLREADELDLDLEKRDFGSWLHALLLRFHDDRPLPRPADEDLAQLLALAGRVQAEQALDAAQLLPFRAAFETFAPRYVQWLQRRDAEGWRWHAGEVERARDADATLPVRLVGRLDRIDRRDGGDAGTTWQLIDYKTGAVDQLKRAVREPLEDTQLAVYAALVAVAEPPAALQAMYLALDERDGPVEIEHDDVAATAAAFVEGLAADWLDLRAGVGLAALGEGPVCEHCEMRGLCRRDHWAAGPPAREEAR
jgi:ATP-dependent helicase/nuclease subunit B